MPTSEAQCHMPLQHFPDMTAQESSSMKSTVAYLATKMVQSSSLKALVNPIIQKVSMATQILEKAPSH